MLKVAVAKKRVVIDVKRMMAGKMCRSNRWQYEDVVKVGDAGYVL
jgi:hypothetical protein